MPNNVWKRARAWALWKALIITNDPDNPLFPAHAKALPEILADPLLD